MFPTILSLYGPLRINSFGTAIAGALAIFYYLMRRDPQCKKLLSTEQLDEIILVGTVVGLIGGRLLFIISEWDQFTHWYEAFFFWDGGFSILGTVIVLVFSLHFYLKKLSIPTLLFYDLCALYAPLLQALSRIGCFLAGCCYGKPTDLIWGVTYTNPHCYAPLAIKLHPTQLYSALLLLGIFLAMHLIHKHITLARGQLIMIYLMFTSAERFLIDFLRDDRVFVNYIPVWSLYQYIALFLFCIACGGFIILRRNGRFSKSV